MGYYNPIYIYGVERFLADANKAGVDGLIVVDLPPEKDEELCLPALKPQGINFIRLATPTTDDKRLPKVLTNTSGFVYYVSVTGITGSGPSASRPTAWWWAPRSSTRSPTRSMPRVLQPPTPSRASPPWCAGLPPAFAPHALRQRSNIPTLGYEPEKTR
jgi:hypothetical protein